MVNPYLEKVLVAYYQRRRRRFLVATAVCAAVAGALVAWVLLAKPAEGWWSTPAAVGMTCALCALVFGAFAAFGDRRILRWLRQGHQVRAVQRGITEIKRKPNSMVLNRVPTIFVQFADDRAGKILSIGNVQELDRIEELLRKQMSNVGTAARA